MWPGLIRSLQKRRAAGVEVQQEEHKEGDDTPPAAATSSHVPTPALQPCASHHALPNTRAVGLQASEIGSQPRQHLSRSEGRRRFSSNSTAASDGSCVNDQATMLPAASVQTFSPVDFQLPGNVIATNADFDTTNKNPPAAVTNAIANFPIIAGLTLKPPTDKETSYIYKWGVRVEVVENGELVCHWICQADESCRRQGTNFTLSHNRTSKPANHLASIHGVISIRTQTQQAVKRKREDEIAHLRSSSLYKTNPRRLNLLVETLRVINNNLAFRFGEYKESRMIEALLKKEDVQVVINYAKVTKAIIELYVSTKNELTSILADSKMVSFGNFVIMSDFWTCTVTHTKYMGVCVYLVDSNWEFRSILLGVRRFSPSYGDRQAGIQGPYKAWMLQLLGDFGLKPIDFFGATSDGGSDVKNLLKNKLNLKWEWCMAHMAHAATKEACGMNGDVERSRNPEMTKLIARIKKTISEVQSIEKTGDLFSALCRTRTKTPTTRLLGYASNRFLSVTEKWSAVVEWYDERRRLASSKPPPQFRLKNNRQELEQILSLLKPISSLKRLCQAEKPNQVDVLMELYQIRLDTLCLDVPVEDYRSERKNPKWIAVDDLTGLAALTRRLLRDALHSRFFYRYTDDLYLDQGDFVFEIQQKLHPEFKNPEKSLNEIVRLLYKEKNIPDETIKIYINRVNSAITARLREMMMKVSLPTEDDAAQPLEFTEQDGEQISRIRERFGSRANGHPAPIRVDRVGQEMRRWEVDPTAIGVNENVLDFWKRMEHTGAYSILPRLAKVIFALPSSSAQIERDFSVCGDMVTSHRASLSKENVDMCAFLNRNEEFVNIAQCEVIPDAELEDHIPQCVAYVLETTPQDVEDEMIVDLFSQTSVAEEVN